MVDTYGVLGFVLGQEAKFSDDFQLVVDQLLLKPQQAHFVARLHQRMNLGSGEADRQAVFRICKILTILQTLYKCEIHIMNRR
jgi:hypothetical protein